MPNGMLLRGMARTAVVAGTATAVSNRVSRRQAERWAEQGEYQPAYMGGGQAAPAAAPPPAAAPAGDDNIAKLKELGELRDSGVLTEAEFEAQKAKLLA
jgi:Short C-terminal domain